MATPFWDRNEQMDGQTETERKLNRQELHCHLKILEVLLQYQSNNEYNHHQQQP